MSRGTYIFRDGELVEKKTGSVVTSDGGKICMPYMMSDIPEYRSPIDGRVIGSRSARRDDLARNGCVEVPPGAFDSRIGALGDNKMARKKGLVT